MKKTLFNKISKIALLFLIVVFVGGFCFQIVSASQNSSMVIDNFSPMGASSNMMPCCGDDYSHLSILDLPPARFIIMLLVFLMLALVPVVFQLIARSSFSRLLYSFAAPPGPDLILSVIKRE